VPDALTNWVEGLYYSLLYKRIAHQCGFVSYTAPAHDDRAGSCSILRYNPVKPCTPQQATRSSCGHVCSCLCLSAASAARETVLGSCNASTQPSHTVAA
jgi:hypothetical protein